MSLLHKLLKLRTEEVFNTVFKECGFMYTTDDIATDGDNYLVFHGTNPIALVAHIDTVRRESVDLIQKGNVIRNKKGVLGADDRAGVYGIIMAARKAYAEGIPVPTLIFTNYEEVGGVGVSTLIKDKALTTKGIRLFVEMDRRGCNEYVFYSWELPKAVKKYVKQWGYVEDYGTYSDISNLTDAYSIPAVNVSCGYYDQHSSSERLHTDELEMNVSRVFQMLQSPIPELHEIKSHKYHDTDWGYYDNYYERAYGKRGSKRGNYSGYNRLAAKTDYRKPKTTYPDSYELDSSIVDADEVDTLQVPCLDSTPRASRYYGDADMRDLKVQIHAELMLDGYLNASLDAVAPDQHHILHDLEENYSMICYTNPDHADDAFEMCWDEAMSKLSPHMRWV